MLNMQDKENLVNTLVEMLDKKLALVNMWLDDDNKEELENLLYRIIDVQEEYK